MADSGSFAVSRNDTGDRLCNYLNIHRHQNQSCQQHQLRRHNHHHQLHETAVAVADADNRTDSDDSNAALSTRSLISASSLSFPSIPPTNVTNLDSFLDSVTPIVATQKSSETNVTYYCLGDLWETFREPSAFGAGVPLLLFGRHPITQYYVPFLSGIQLYIDPQNPHINLSSAGRCPGEENDNNLMRAKSMWRSSSSLSSSSSSSSSSHGRLVFEYMEQEQPHSRRPLADKIWNLASGFPGLINYRSCDLSPSSWICVAWYPIYRIPVGPTLKDLDASFLTFHSLSTQTQPQEEADDRLHLPVIGLASYKLKGSVISPNAPKECQQHNALFQAATNWLNNLQALALLPDYLFFLNRYHSQ
ncbi:uncharacterized protein LOC111880982 [Lactuca sativa]|uniref:uncharacterized protein LOC111880982 n=1 Tax=Lactuca sativa TaxID=4236 RepID=UPI0022AE8E5D|nr:uncharacterized protein LOC111880982 [Lactuca sativa]